jgi:dTDP-D-glucose 4,6-dehydratase
LNKSSEIERLTGSLQVDISHTIEKLGWRPPESLDKNLCKMVKWYLNKR